MSDQMKYHKFMLPFKIKENIWFAANVNYYILFIPLLYHYKVINGNGTEYKKDWFHDFA